MREISRFFKVSLKSVAVVFERLSKEGQLTIVRGSHTVLEGARKGPRVKLRGVVGVPVALPSFIFGNNPRTFFICLENELQKHGYVVDFIFYLTVELENERLMRRLLEHKMDIVFWNAPIKAAGGIMLQLQDTGVRVVALGDLPEMFPVQQYVLDLTSGFCGVARGWKAGGIKEVYFIGPRKSLAPHFLAIGKQAFESAGMVIHEEKVDPPDFFKLWPKIPWRKNAPDRFFWSTFHYENLCNCDAKTMQSVFETGRTLLSQGPVYHSAFQGSPLFADSIHMDFDEMARRIALDISMQNYLETRTPHFFKASWQSKCDLGATKRLS